MIKKLTTTLVAITMIFSLTACNNSDVSNSTGNNNSTTSGSSQNSQNTLTFDEFVDTLPVEFIGDESIDLNFLFLNPENYGFEEKLLRLPYSSEEEVVESIEETIEVLAKLHEYDRNSLDVQQKLTYDVVEHFLGQVLDLSKYGYIDRGYLGSFLGYQAQLPLLLNEFTFTKKSDLDNYFNILETADETFQLYAELEVIKIGEGVGMSQLIIDKVIEQCVNFTKEEDNFLIDAINTKIDNMSFLTDDEKISAKEKNETLIMVNFRDAYKNLGESLSQLVGREDDNGLWSLPDGKDYYEDVLQYYTGTNLTVKEIEMETLNFLQHYSNIATEIYKTDYEAISDYFSSGMILVEFDNVDENIQFLIEKVVEDFPSIGELNYTVTPVPKEMEENFSPAAYVVSQIDSPMDTPESIYLNGEYSSSLYEMIAHEGYPGHMYQNAFYKQLNAPAIRYIIDYPGYSEGWATYVENNAVKYTDVDDAVKTMVKANTIVTQMYYVLMDIDLHYNELDRTAFTTKYADIFGGSPIGFYGIYDLMLETPGNYPKYFYSAMKFQQMYDETEIALGDLFSSIDFHNVILTSGSAPFEILQAQLDIYIEETLESATQISIDDDLNSVVEEDEEENVA